MNLNALRQYLELYDREIPASRANTASYMNESSAARQSRQGMDATNNALRRMRFAEGMAQQEGPRTPDAYDLQQKANSDARSMSTMRDASRFADVADMEAMQRFLPKQQAPQEQYDNEGLPVGRNYGRQLDNQRWRSAYIPDMGEGQQMAASRRALVNAQTAQTQAQTQRMGQRPPDFFGGNELQAMLQPRPGTQANQRMPGIENYLARLMGGR